MERKRFIGAMRVVTIVLILITAAFAGAVGYSLLQPAPSPAHVPYPGLTLAYVNNKSYDTGSFKYGDCTMTVMYYLSETSNGLLRVNASEELFTIPLLLNATTRQYASGRETGQYSHLIPTDLRIGDKVAISLNRVFTVVSTNATVVLGGGLQVQALALRYHNYSVTNGATDNRTTVRYYDTEYGIFVKEFDDDATRNPGGYDTSIHVNVTLVDDEHPPVEGGLSNYQALFVAHTNPLVADSGQNYLLDELILALLVASTVVSFKVYHDASRKPQPEQ